MEQKVSKKIIILSSILLSGLMGLSFKNVDAATETIIICEGKEIAETTTGKKGCYEYNSGVNKELVFIYKELTAEPSKYNYDRFVKAYNDNKKYELPVEYSKAVTDYAIISAAYTEINNYVNETKGEPYTVNGTPPYQSLVKATVAIEKVWNNPEIYFQANRIIVKLEDNFERHYNAWNKNFEVLHTDADKLNFLNSQDLTSLTTRIDYGEKIAKKGAIPPTYAVPTGFSSYYAWYGVYEKNVKVLRDAVAQMKIIKEISGEVKNYTPSQIKEAKKKTSQANATQLQKFADTQKMINYLFDYWYVEAFVREMENDSAKLEYSYFTNAKNLHSKLVLPGYRNNTLLNQIKSEHSALNNRLVTLENKIQQNKRNDVEKAEALYTSGGLNDAKLIEVKRSIGKLPESNFKKELINRIEKLKANLVIQNQNNFADRIESNLQGEANVDNILMMQNRVSDFGSDILNGVNKNELQSQIVNQLENMYDAANASVSKVEGTKAMVDFSNASLLVGKLSHNYVPNSGVTKAMLQERLDMLNIEAMTTANYDEIVNKVAQSLNSDQLNFKISVYEFAITSYDFGISKNMFSQSQKNTLINQIFLLKQNIFEYIDAMINGIVSDNDNFAKNYNRAALTINSMSTSEVAKDFKLYALIKIKFINDELKISNVTKKYESLTNQALTSTNLSKIVGLRIEMQTVDSIRLNEQIYKLLEKERKIQSKIAKLVFEVKGNPTKSNLLELTAQYNQIPYDSNVTFTNNNQFITVSEIKAIILNAATTVVLKDKIQHAENLLNKADDNGSFINVQNAYNYINTLPKDNIATNSIFNRMNVHINNYIKQVESYVVNAEKQKTKESIEAANKVLIYVLDKNIKNEFKERLKNIN